MAAKTIGLRALSYNFETIKGKVYIAGLTGKKDQLDAVIESTKNVKGVKEIVNLNELLDSSLVLWIGLAWPSTVSGPHPVQVTINGDNGNTLSSTIVQTTLTSSLHPESAGVRMTDAAEVVRKLALSVSE